MTNESSYGTEFDVFGVFSPKDTLPAAAQPEQKTTAELVKFAELSRAPHMVKHSTVDLSKWLAGNAQPREGKAKASTSSTAGQQAGAWLSKLSSRRAAEKKPFAERSKRRVPADAEAGGEEYQQKTKDAYNGAIPKESDKVQYTFLSATHFAVVAKLYGDGSLLACRRVAIADDNSVSLTDTIDFVNAAEHKLIVLSTFPTVKQLVSQAVAGFLGSNNGLIQ